MSYLDDLIQLTKRIEFTQNEKICQDYNEGMETAVTFFMQKKKECARLFFIGNGGSASIANHMNADFLKNGGMRVCSLYNSSILTCLGNDYGYEYVFSKQLEMMMEEGDLLVAISSSGESSNIRNAINAAKNIGGYVLTFTGFEPDNFARRSGDMNIYVPSHQYGMVESLHNVMLQQIVDEIMEPDTVYEREA